ncbi:MAG: spore coat protein GerQ [Bacilli bacterium]|nr:spore coat protein GerQ [Bacilli bacterium]
MNGSYYNNAFPNQNQTNQAFPGSGLSSNTVPNQQSVPSYQSQYGLDIDEQSYIENILRLNRGKKARLHVTVPGSSEWQDRVFDGIIEQAGKDHVIMSNPSTGEWYLILIIYLDFVTFEEPINYNTQYYQP